MGNKNVDMACKTLCRRPSTYRCSASHCLPYSMSRELHMSSSWLHHRSFFDSLYMHPTWQINFSQLILALKIFLHTLMSWHGHLYNHWSTKLFYTLYKFYTIFKCQTICTIIKNTLKYGYIHGNVLEKNNWSYKRSFILSQI